MRHTHKWAIGFLVGLFLFLGAGQALAAQYTVQNGDSLYLIGSRFGITAAALKQMNGLNSSSLYPGQVLQVPSAAGRYTVKSGNSLYSISLMFNTTVDNLKKMNGLTSTYLSAGQILAVPPYTVKSGDSLYSISQKFGVTVASIKSANGLSSTSLTPGQKLLINGGAAGTAGSSASRTTSSTASRSGSGSYARSEVLLLARLINGEARGESYEGQVAVGAVVLNRVASSLFPNTLAGVIYQTNEFSVVNDGQINLTPSATAIKAAENAMDGWDPCYNALFYWNPVKSPNNAFLNAKTIVARIGSHVFAR